MYALFFPRICSRPFVCSLVCRGWAGWCGEHTLAFAGQGAPCPRPCTWGCCPGRSAPGTTCGLAAAFVPSADIVCLPFPDDLLANRAALRATFHPENLTEAVLGAARAPGSVIKDRPWLRGPFPPDPSSVWKHGHGICAVSPSSPLNHRSGNMSKGPAPITPHATNIGNTSLGYSLS